MTFAELQRGVFDDLQYQAQPKPGVQDRVRRYLNEGLERVLRRPRLKNLRLGTMPLTTVPDRGFYGLPQILERIDYIIDLTNGGRLPFRTRDWYRSQDPSVRTSGTPSVWIPEGIVPVLRQPIAKYSSPLQVRLFVRSDRPEDVAPIGLIGRVTYHLGFEVDMSAYITGTTPAWMGWETSPPVEVTALSLTTTCLGMIYVTDDELGGVNPQDPVAVIERGTIAPRHVGVRLYPTPSAAITYQIEGQRVIPKMMYDWDEPPLPVQFHEMLQCYARGRFYRKDGRLTQSQAEMAEFERYALDLTVFVEYPSNYKPVAGKLSTQGSGWSDLGPSYPADRTGILD